jgi:hypothetical protein
MSEVGDRILINDLREKYERLQRDMEILQVELYNLKVKQTQLPEGISFVKLPDEEHSIFSMPVFIMLGLIVGYILGRLFS